MFSSEFSFVGVTEVGVVSQDDVVNEFDVHDSCCFFEFLCQSVVLEARFRVSRGVVVAERDAGGSGEQGFFECESHVHRGARQSAAAQEFASFESEALAQQEQPAFLHRFPLHGGEEELIDEVRVGVARLVRVVLLLQRHSLRYCLNR